MKHTDPRNNPRDHAHNHSEPYRMDARNQRLWDQAIRDGIFQLDGIDQDLYTATNELMDAHEAARRGAYDQATELMGQTIDILRDISERVRNAQGVLRAERQTSDATLRDQAAMIRNYTRDYFRGFMDPNPRIGNPPQQQGGPNRAPHVIQLHPRQDGTSRQSAYEIHDDDEGPASPDDAEHYGRRRPAN